MSATEILLAEDNPGDVMLLEDALEQSGWEHRLHLVRDGAEALDYLLRRGAHAQAIRPDLILLDLNLPIRNGREVLAETRTDPEVAAIPLVILSGSEWEQGVLKEYGLPGGHYLVKPMNFRGYREMVSNLERLWRNLARV
jgi:CheY-like chemotaxis protein